MNFKHNFLITGGAGFIGFHLAQKLVKMDCMITIIDDLNDYYDINLKFDRLKKLGISSFENLDSIIKSDKYENLFFKKLNITKKNKINNLIKEKKINFIVNLAAQAGVRHSLDNPQLYVDSNISGFLSILEVCRVNKIKKLVYASSSSVYGNNQKIPFSVNDELIHPASIYAVSKITNELMAYTYKHLYNLSSIGVRFFTVYGPWGRPDMAYFKFTKAAFDNEEIKVFNHGNLFRDFTYIDDAIIGIEKIIKRLTEFNDLHEVFNIGHNDPLKITDFIKFIESETCKKIKIKNISGQKGDVNKTHADISESIIKLNFRPKTSIKYGLKEFVSWYKLYHGI